MQSLTADVHEQLLRMIEKVVEISAAAGVLSYVDLVLGEVRSPNTPTWFTALHAFPENDNCCSPARIYPPLRIV